LWPAVLSVSTIIRRVEGESSTAIIVAITIVPIVPKK
jgi:hypothetical protein